MAETWERNWRWTMPPGLAASRLLFRLEVAGRARLPEGPVIVAANHLSHVDPPFVGAAVRRPVRFLAAADLLGLNAGLDFMIPFFGAIPLPRVGVPKSALQAALAHLERGGTLGVFPEGRRTAYWGETDPKEGGAWLALRAQVPLVPVAVIGTDRVMSLEANVPRPAKVKVAFGDPIMPLGTRAEITARWASSIDQLLGPGGEPGLRPR